MRPSRSPLPSVSPRSWTPTHSIPSSKPGSAAGWTPSPSWTSARSPRRTGAESRGLDVCPGGPLAQAGDRSSGEAPAPQLVMSWASSSGACPLRSGAWVCVRAVPSPSSFLLFPCSRGAFPETLRRAAAVVLGTVGSPGTQSAPQPSLPLGRRGPGAPLSFHSCARPGHWPCPWGAHVVKACSSAIFLSTRVASFFPRIGGMLVSPRRPTMEKMASRKRSPQHTAHRRMVVSMPDLQDIAIPELPPRNASLRDDIPGSRGRGSSSGDDGQSSPRGCGLSPRRSWKDTRARFRDGNGLFLNAAFVMFSECPFWKPCAL